MASASPETVFSPVTPRVSVLMPTFEQSAFIGRALDSLWAQAYRDWELVIVDDGSRDDTAAALAPWLADASVRYLRFDGNGGLGRAINAGRVLALEALGHRPYGLWTPAPAWFNTVGPLPFGQVQELPRHGWREALARIEPDLVYAQLNWQAVPFVHEVLMQTPDLPFIWHFKEGPFICIEKGTWPLLADLVRLADGCIYSSPEMRDWFATAIPHLPAGRPDHVLDGDLPRRAWFTQERSPLLSAASGQVHTVVPGRPIGLHPPTVAELARHGIHLHFYGDFTQGQWREWIARAGALAPEHLHLHPNVGQDGWVREFSQYDAGWLHVFTSANGGDIRRADWDDLNIPARVATLAAAGLPMIQLAFFERVIDHARRRGRAQARAPTQVPGRRAMRDARDGWGAARAG